MHVEVQAIFENFRKFSNIFDFLFRKFFSKFLEKSFENGRFFFDFLSKFSKIFENSVLQPLTVFLCGVVVGIYAFKFRRFAMCWAQLLS